jgi:hypothetical protein
MAVHAFTSFSYSYIDRARVFAQSLRRQHPEWIIWAVLTDKEPPGYRFDWSKEVYDRVVTVEDLFGDEAERWLFAHEIVEACTAVKGRALQYILKDATAEKVFYFDPDIALFNSMDPVVELLDRHSIVLTPHQLDPEPIDDVMAIIDNEIASLIFGVFNLGFIAVRNDPEAARFADWWADRLHDWCYDRFQMGIFVDQKWCNLIPCFFDNVKVLRDPGYNVASWNLSQRKLQFTGDGAAEINGALLRFYHFTKLGPTGAVMTHRYARGNSEIFELWWWYRDQIEKARDPNVPERWWHYGTFADGTPIPSSVRELYRHRKDLRAAFPFPFSTGPNDFLSWLRVNTELLAA